MRTEKGPVLLLTSLLAATATGCGVKPVSFKQEVHPVLQKYCVSCHAPGGEGYEKSGFSVQDYQAVLKGTKFGPVITPGSSISSTLVLLIEHKADPSINMPPVSQDTTTPLREHEKYIKDWKLQKLPPEDIKRIRAWIDQGAKDN